MQRTAEIIPEIVHLILMIPSTKKWPFPEPDPNVCGASVDKAAYWNFINTQLGNGDLINDPVTDPVTGPGADPVTDPATEKDQPVLRRYFGWGAAAGIGLQSAGQLLKDICAGDEPRCPVCPLKYNCAWYAGQRGTDSLSGHETGRAATERAAKDRSAPSFADFFCGAGGLSLGFEWAGLNPKIATDLDPWCMATYAYNRSNATIEMSAGDIRDWLASHKRRKSWDIDIVTGGVPCQSFSTANRQRRDNDPRDKLYTSLLDACRMIGPRFILIENVSGMLKEYDGVIHDLDRLGYHAAHILLNAKDYGIPQNRRRVFFLAVSGKHYPDAEARLRSTIAAIVDKKTGVPIPLAAAIGDLPTLLAHSKRNDTSFNNAASGRAFTMHTLSGASGWVRSLHAGATTVPLFHHKARYNNRRDIEIFGRLRPGENSLAASIREIMPYANRNGIFKDKYFKLRHDEYCRTITAHMRYDCNMYIHPEQARGLTAREAARVQSFPDDYVFLGNFQRLYHQIGNAVPPMLARVLGEAIRENLHAASGGSAGHTTAIGGSPDHAPLVKKIQAMGRSPKKQLNESI
ncbi:MAG TPA: DNA cytosine methyltransferase [Puia sp.]|nr:DNA cytosine methyltransferase [Puia sp.]